MITDTKTLYDENANKWERKEPNSLSDFTARARLFDLCGDIKGHTVIDLGAGEGYCARELARRGAGRIQAIELSPQMVELAKAQQSPDDEIIHYQQGDVTALPYPDNQFDLAIGVFVYNYLHVADIYRSFKEAYRVLKPGGIFLFSVPHPAFPFIRKERSRPFYFDTGEAGYFSSRDRLFAGKISCRDGTDLSVQMIPKTLEDYFGALTEAGFKRLPSITEYGVTENLMELDSDFFGPLNDIPLHLSISIIK